MKVEILGKIDEKLIKEIFLAGSRINQKLNLLKHLKKISKESRTSETFSEPCKMPVKKALVKLVESI